MWRSFNGFFPFIGQLECLNELEESFEDNCIATEGSSMRKGRGLSINASELTAWDDVFGCSGLKFLHGFSPHELIAFSMVFFDDIIKTAS